MRLQTLPWIRVALIHAVLVFSIVGSALAQGPDLYMKDTPADNGTEPNPAGPDVAMWVSEDIWVRTSADPDYDPAPFPAGAPSWSLPGHESPEFRDPKYGLPNYVYVRVGNRGDVASSGTERLRLYWSKAATNTIWPTHWVDYLFRDDKCNSATELYGSEVTKPRKNAATATQAELDAYRDAVIEVAADPFLFPDGVSYWAKQNVVHAFGPSNRHGSPAFLAWHREITNRFEVLLQEADPTVKLLYWDWMTDPQPLFTTSFMGASGRGGEIEVAEPFETILPKFSRNLQDGDPPALVTGVTDTALLGISDYPTFRQTVEEPTHANTHIYLYPGFTAKAASDPFFFLLHANVDRIWAAWQRNPAIPGRVDPTSVYGTDSGHASITTAMAPWDGTGLLDIEPWFSLGSAVEKSPLHASVVSPPIYDTAPLLIPILLPSQEAILEIPWYPPNPADFTALTTDVEDVEHCGDPRHFCLLARIETAEADLGMATEELTNVEDNTRANNNIAWKNLTVVDDVDGAFAMTSVIMRNSVGERVAAGLRLRSVQKPGGTRNANALPSDFSRILIELSPVLSKRWRAAGQRGSGIKVGDGGEIEVISSDAVLQGITLEPKETFTVGVRFELRKDYQIQTGTPNVFDLIQTGAPGRPDAVVGGQRFEIDLTKLVLAGRRAAWRYLDDASDPGATWKSADFDDSKWRTGNGRIGVGHNPTTTLRRAPGDKRITTYFRHSFQVDDPDFLRNVLLRIKRDDGAAVYLNGKEIHRVNLPAAAGRETTATRDVTGLEERMFFPVRVGLDLLRRGRNVLAVEIHQHSLSRDLTFELELSANRATSRFAPEVAFSSPANGMLAQNGELVPIRIDALDSDGTIASVALFANGKLVGTDSKAPFAFEWKSPGLGRHRLRAVASDNEKQQAAANLKLIVVENLRPSVSLTEPADGALFAIGQSVSVVSQPTDRGGKVVRVDFLLRSAERFGSPRRKVGSASVAPWATSLSGLAPGLYMLSAVAVDDKGLETESNPIHFALGREHTGH